MIAKKMVKYVEGSSVIRAMFEEGKKMAAKYGAENVYDFSLGNPSTLPPKEVNEAIIDIASNEDPNRLHGYMNNSGFEDVREAIAQSLNKRFDTHFSQKNILMTVGAAGGLNVILKSIIDPEDEVIAFAPYFGEYNNYVANFDGKIVAVSPNPPSFQPNIKEFATLSEQELDRIETLVQSLLKITKLDAGSIVIEKSMESVADMMQDVEQHFAYRARQEQKEILLSESEDISLLCDRDWLIEAIDNIVKNALDHTANGDTVRIEWKALSNAVQIVVKDNGCGIHPEDLHHIFKRFYRSRFSKDKQGIGLGLPLAKAIVEAHSGSIEVDSELGRGTTFTMNFLIPTKL